LNVEAAGRYGHCLTWGIGRRVIRCHCFIEPLSASCTMATHINAKEYETGVFSLPEEKVAPAFGTTKVPRDQMRNAR